KDSGCELNLVGRGDAICFWRKHSWRSDPLRDEVGEADDKPCDAAKQKRSQWIVLSRLREYRTNQRASFSGRHEPDEDDEGVGEGEGRVYNSEEQCSQEKGNAPAA